MKQEESLNNSVRAMRQRLGMSQQQLADAAGVARQTVSGIEGGLYAASTMVALRLARVLGCSVEELFWLEEDRPAVDATLVGPAVPAGQTSQIRALVAQVHGRWVAHSLEADRAFRSEVVPADGLVISASMDSVRVRLLDEQETAARTVLLAGCAPPLSLWARSAERWHHGLRVHWIHANSMAALQMLQDGVVHTAGLHLPGGSAANADSVRNALPGAQMALVHLGEWQEGLLLAPGNPKGVKEVGDLANPDVRIVNREEGAGARILLEGALIEAGVQPEAVNGWGSVVTSHIEVARSVAGGAADSGMSTEAMASLFNLDFLPIQSVRYEMAVRAQDMAEPHIRELFATLSHRWVRAQLRLLGGFDTTRTGETTYA